MPNVKMRPYWWLVGLLCAVGASFAGEAPARFPAEARINADRVNVRPGPGADPPLGQLSKGESVVVRRRDGDWFEIDYPASLGLWAVRKYVKSVEGDIDAASELTPVRAVIERDRLQVRSIPSTRGAVVAELSKGDEIVVIGTFDGWCRISGRAKGALSRLVAYVHANYVEILQPTPQHTEAKDVKADVLGEALARARTVLAGPETPSLQEVISVLRALDQALSSCGGTEQELARSKIASVLGDVPPARWLAILEPPGPKGKSSSGRRLREVLDDLEETPPTSFTARGTLQRSPHGGTYRLMRGETVLYELRSAADLAPFLGKEVGVIGDVSPPRREGGCHYIDVLYIEELK